MKRFYQISYTALLICLCVAGAACSKTSNTTSNTKTEANAASTPTAAGGGGTGSASMPVSSPTSSPVAESTSAPLVDEVDVYLVAVGDNGKKGLKIGCDDSLIAIARKIKPTVAPLKAAIEELLSIPHEYNKELGNYWWGKNLKLKSVSITEGVATIHITGEGPFIAGVCDEPRITEQIENTAMQFSSVNKVKVFVNDEPLADAIR